jgi:glutamyl-tRNA reductase
MTEIGIVGTSVWQQNLALLEGLTISPDQRERMLPELKRALGADEIIYLATCNRVELIYSTSHGLVPSSALHRLVDFFFRDGRSISFFPNDFHQLTGREATAHIFRMVSSLDSVVMGETQIAGQFKDAWQAAQHLGTAGPVLDSLAQSALQCARRVKRETSLNEGCVSMASLSLDVIVEHINGLSAPRIAVVGSGIMTRKLAKLLKNVPGVELLFVNRSVEKVREIAAEYGAHVLPLADFIANPPSVDVIISSTSAPGAVFDGEFAKRLPRLTESTLCIDMAVPRDFARELDSNPDVTVVDINALKARQQQNLRKKFISAGEANRIVREDVDLYYSGAIETRLRPLFQESFEKAKELAKSSLGKFLEKEGVALSDSQRADLERTVSKVLARSSFEPLRSLAAALGQTSVSPDQAVSKLPEYQRRVG